MEQARANGHEPLEVLERGPRAAADHPRRRSFVESAREKAKDPEGAERRAQEWAERNRDAIAERNRMIEERGLLSDYEPLKPRWMR